MPKRNPVLHGLQTLTSTAAAPGCYLLNGPKQPKPTNVVTLMDAPRGARKTGYRAGEAGDGAL